MTDEDQQVLVAGLRRRDESALAAFYDATSRRAFGLAYRVLGDGAAAEDVLQAAYLAIWEQADELDQSRGSVESLLMTIVHRRAVDAARARARVQARSGNLEVDPIDPAPDALEEAVRAEDATSVRAALDELPEPQRRAVVLAYFEGMTYAEVAEAEGVPLGTVKSRMRLAMERLRDVLGAAPV
jgi:RNA polymerase sigma-70 factor (ECF subfamily)